MILTQSHFRKFCLPTLVLSLMFILQPSMTAQDKQSKRTISLQFSDRAIGDSAIQTAYLRNTSISAMTISSISTSSSVFTTVAHSTTIGSQDSVALEVKFKPVIFGTIIDTLKISSDEGDADIVLTGTSPYPIIYSFQTNLVFGDVARNTTRHLTVELSNTSINRLTIDSIYTNTSKFSVNKTTLSMDTSDSIEVTFAPTGAGNYSDTLYLRNNSETPFVKIPLTGNSPSPVLSASATKVLLLNIKSDGLAKEKAEEFFQKLQNKLSLYTLLNVQQKDQFMSTLGEEDQKALAACTQLSCIAEIASKAGIERIVVCTITKKGAVYLFRSLEFDVITNAKRSQVDEQQACKSQAELNEFQNRVAVVLGQKIAGVTYIPKGLQPSATSWWWYAGAAATIGLGVGIYFLVSTSSETAGPQSMTLPVPPDLP